MPSGAVVLEGREIPAKVRRELDDEQSAAFIPHAGRYVETSKNQASISEALSLDEVRFN